MRNGTYETTTGERVTVQRTGSGYRLTHADGSTSFIGDEVSK
jgi:hypothetical protein